MTGNVPIWVMAQAPAGQPSLLFQMVPFILIFVVFYFLLIVPARRKQKKHADMMSALKPGDRVITNGGIYGTVVGVTDTIIQLRIADQVKIDVSKTAVAGLAERKD